jgi:hypothetical protein
VDRDNLRHTGWAILQELCARTALTPDPRGDMAVVDEIIQSRAEHVAAQASRLNVAGVAAGAAPFSVDELIPIYEESFLWATSAFPQVTLGHKLAASLAASRAPAEEAASIIRPWHCFIVTPPKGLLPFRTTANFESDVDHIRYIDRNDGRLVVSVESRGHGTIARATAKDFAQAIATAEREQWSPTRWSDEAHRAAILALRLFVGVCVELSATPNLPTSAQIADRSGARAPKRGRDAPTSWTFSLKRPVKVDCREALVDYIRGGGRSPTVQSLVRGHWKRQACGPGGSHRRLVHIEPYWRGPEDAPIAVRPHDLGESG